VPVLFDERVRPAWHGVAMTISALPLRSDRPTPLQGMSRAELEDALVQAQRQVNSAEAHRAAVICELLDRAQVADRVVDPHDDFPGHRASQEEFVADHVAALLGCTKAAASTMLDVAVEASRHPVLATAWNRGDVDSRKVAVVTDQLRPFDRALSPRLVESAVEYATGHTAPQLRLWLERRVLRADPSLATIRRKRASAHRRVTLTPLADGMAELAAYLPSVQARQLFDTVNTVATSAGRDDLRGMDQRRADALVDLVVGRAEPPQISVNVVVTADSLLESEAEPGWVTGVGALPPDEVTAVLLAGETTWRRLMADETTGVLTDVSERQYRPSHRLDRAVRTRDLTCRFPGCRRPALGPAGGTGFDHTRAWPSGDTSAANLAVLCRHHHRLKHSAGWRVSTESDGRMTWTTPGGGTIVTTPWQYVDPPERPPD
jgi:hypothetical protein